MQANNIFDPRRFWLLLKEEFRLEYKRYLLGLGVVFGGLLIIWWANGLNNIVPERQVEEFHYIWFGIILIGGGAFFTSLAYTQLGTKPTRLFYLNLPASALEKFSAKWLVTAIIYPIVIWGLYLLFSWLVNKIHIGYTDGKPFTMLPAFGKTTWILMKIYLVVQSIFLLGAIVFHRYAIFKTAFSMLILGAFLVLATYIGFRIIFPEMFVGWSAPEPPTSVYNFTDAFRTFVDEQLEGVMERIFWIAVAPFMLVIGFFKLKEKEV